MYDVEILFWPVNIQHKVKNLPEVNTVQITFIFIDFRICDFAFAFETPNDPAFRVLDAFDFQTDFNLRFKRKRDIRFTCKHV